MGYRKVNDDSLIAIADTIRETYNLTNTLTFPDDYVSSIRDGMPLNFKVVGGTTEPTNPVENTIWVSTDTKITSWEFSTYIPQSPAEGLVWFNTSTSAVAEFNATKKNALMIYPNGCTQYISGEWVSKDTMTYQNGVWKSWMLYLYDKGAFNEVAGGMTQRPVSLGTTGGVCAIEQRADHVSVRSDSGSSALAYFSSKIDLTPYKTFCFYGAVYHHTIGGAPFCKIGVWDASFNGVALLEGTRSEGLHTLDISELSGEYYIGIAIYGFTDYIECKMSELYLK